MWEIWEVIKDLIKYHHTEVTHPGYDHIELDDVPTGAHSVAASEPTLQYVPTPHSTHWRALLTWLPSLLPLPRPLPWVWLLPPLRCESSG